jgi:hypothetical protein
LQLAAGPGCSSVYAQLFIQPEQSLYAHYPIVIQFMFELKQAHPLLQGSIKFLVGQGALLSIQTGEQLRYLLYHRTIVAQGQGSFEALRRVPQKAVAASPRRA